VGVRKDETRLVAVSVALELILSGLQSSQYKCHFLMWQYPVSCFYYCKTDS
jgi:hypothetical protein